MAKRRIGLILIVLGVVLGLSAAGLAGYNMWDSHRAGVEAERVLATIIRHRQETETSDNSHVSESYEDSHEDDEATGTLPVLEVDGNLYIGTVSVPALSLELPVLESWDMTLLKIAPCRYMGSPYTGDFIICAHNYDTHFGRLGELAAGDTVIFTDVEGKEFSYVIAATEDLAGTAVEEMESGEWDLTLFTCTLNGQTRITVRCNLQDKG